MHLCKMKFFFELHFPQLNDIMKSSDSKEPKSLFFCFLLLYFEELDRNRPYPFLV